jgi:hypothetical protein
MSMSAPYGSHGEPHTQYSSTSSHTDAGSEVEVEVEADADAEVEAGSEGGAEAQAASVLALFCAEQAGQNQGPCGCKERGREGDR